MEKVALVVGSSGMAGSSLSKELLAQGWQVYGLSRRNTNSLEGVTSIQANLLDFDNLKEALRAVTPTHVFFTTWMRGSSEEENITINGTMIRNLLNIIGERKSVKHVGLVTGLKHYLGPFEAYATNSNLPETPFREEQPRLDYPNFYYAQEDEIYAAAKRDHFSWSVHRPHTLIGNAVGNLMNMGTTLAVYASICKEEGLPFVFPGSQAQWNGISDVTDVQILSKQMLWAAQTPAAFNQAFNVVNGDVFRWSWLWKQIAEWFSIEYIGYENESRPLTTTLQNKGETWRKMARSYGLREEELSRVSSAWHTDLDLGRPMEVMTDMSRSRALGFREFYQTKHSFFKLFEQLRVDRIIP